MSSGGVKEITAALPMADARYVKAKTCVWWDIENCRVPRSCDPYSIAQNISKSLADMNYKGVVTISAYGDTTQINSSVQQALSSTGIALNHVPAGIKDASDKKILVDMLIWGYDNPPPANHLLISGDRDFSNALHQLSMRRYNILLAQPEKASQALVSAAKTVWLWTSLVVGGRPFEKLPSFHNTSTNSKSNIMTESISIVHPSQSNDFNLKNNNNGNFDNHKKQEQISRTQSQPVINTSSFNGKEEGDKQSIGSSDSSNSHQRNDLRHHILSTQPENVSQALVSAAKTVWQWTSLVVGGRPIEKTPNLHDTLANSKSNNETQGNSILYSSQPDDLNQKSSNIGNFDNHNEAKQISKSQSEPIMTTSSSNGNEDGSIPSIGSSDSSYLNQKNYLKTPDLCSNCIPKSQQYVDSGKSNAPCGRPTSNYTCKIKQKLEKIPSNTTMSTSNGSGAQESTIDEMIKMDNNNSTLARPSPFVVPESSKPYLSTGPTPANIQLGPDMASSNHKNELTQPSHAHEEKEGGNKSKTSSSYSTKSSSPALPESNPTNAPKINATVKVATKKNRKKHHKQQQNQCSQSCVPSRNLSGSNYNQSSSSSTVPTIRPNNYQAVHSTMPYVPPPTPLHVQMGFILEALNILKSEKISPTEASISDCIHYGSISVQNFSVKMALDYAVEHQVVVMHRLGNHMPLYVGRNDTLWNCVNFMDSDADLGTENFDAVLKFLSSANGRSAILSSQCRYQAALILRQLCLKEIVLGEILQILHIIIQIRKWIIPHASGWQPLAVPILLLSVAGICWWWRWNIFFSVGYVDECWIPHINHVTINDFSVGSSDFHQ